MYNQIQISRVSSVLRNNKTNYWTGDQCKKFEKEFSNYIGNKYSISVSNGSVALEIALKSLNLKQGDKIIVTPRSFVISASCVINEGLKPIFADVDKNGNLNSDSISKVFDNKVKAIVLVHLNGLSCDMDPIIKFVKKKKLFLIEDCSQAHGAKYKGKSVGTFGHISTWSFCQDKIISTGGEGGMISTNNKKLWKYCWSYKDHGKNYYKIKKKNYKYVFKWVHDHHGTNHRMTEMQAAIGRYQLKNLNKQIKKRNQIVSFYLKSLKIFWKEKNLLEKPDFTCSNCPLKIKDNKKCNLCIHSFYRLNFFVNLKKINQTKLIYELNKKKISCGVGSCPEIYKEKVFKKSKIFPKNNLTNAIKLGKTSLMFPINPYKSLSKIKLEISLVKKILNNYI